MHRENDSPYVTIDQSYAPILLYEFLALTLLVTRKEHSDGLIDNVSL
jgi:hypothetical protein